MTTDVPEYHEQQLATLEADVALARKEVALLEAFQRLENNADFKLLIEEGFCKEYILRLVGLSISMNAKPDHQKLYQAQTIAGTVLQQYLRGIETAGYAAREKLIDAPSTAQFHRVQMSQGV